LDAATESIDFVERPFDALAVNFTEKLELKNTAISKGTKMFKYFYFYHFFRHISFWGSAGLPWIAD